VSAGIPIGLCQCGCGQAAPIAKKTDTARERIKGQALRFIKGHNGVDHGYAYSPEYEAYINAKARCERPTHSEYCRYGALGVKFLFNTFVEFFAAVGKRPSPQHSLSRHVDTGNYETGNVEWGTTADQVAEHYGKKAMLALRAYHQKKAA